MSSYHGPPNVVKMSAVAQQTRRRQRVGTVDKAAWRQAEDASGLSQLEIASRLNVTERTYQRWRQAGTIPAPVAESFTRLLDVPVKMPARPSLPVTDVDRMTTSELAAVTRPLIEELLERLRQEYGEPPRAAQQA